MYKTLLVHIDESARARHRAEVAAALALQFEAHLTGAAATGLAAYMLPDVAFNAATPPVVFPVEQLRAEANRALDVFDAAAAAAGVASFERAMLDDDAGVAVSLLARYSDLVILGQTPPDEFLPRTRADFPEYVLLNGGRPVLVLPYSGVKAVPGARVTVAWNGSVEALRAITSAIPLLRRAERVDLVVFDPDPRDGVHGEEPGADMALYLARHDIAVEVSTGQASGEEGESLLTFAADKGSDLIVMGAYGHSRFRELVLGGMSRTALQSSPVALWMCH